MKKIIQYLQVVPMILITSYIGFYFFIEFQTYANLHYKYLELTDNIFVVMSISTFAMGGYKIWNKVAVRSFWSIILLNLITEFDIENYYQIYSIIVQLFLITLTLTQIPIKQIWR